MRECKRFKVYSACDHVLTTCENTINQDRSKQFLGTGKQGAVYHY